MSRRRERHLHERRRLRARGYRRIQDAAATPVAARSDVINRFAMMKPHSSARWLCRQSNGRIKACFRSEQVAQQAADLLRDYGEPMRLSPYACRTGELLELVGPHWHLTSGS